MSDSTICAAGCASAAKCTGECQPKPRDQRRCKWCLQGYGLAGGEHWIVRSIGPARLDIRECTA